MTSSDTATPAAYVSRADVATDVPARYAKQLVSHLGRKIDFEEENGTWAASVQSAVARITPGDGVLTLEAEAADLTALALVEHALGSHLKRFGQRNELRVTWHRTPTTA